MTTHATELLRRIAAHPDHFQPTEDQPPPPAPHVVRVQLQMAPPPPPTAGQKAWQFVLGFAVAFGMASAIIAALTS